MEISFKNTLISGLKEELETAKATDLQQVAAGIRNTGFSCLMCGKCCRREHGDNSVAVGPAEIERICLYACLDKNEVAQPPLEHPDIRDHEALEELSELIDIHGNIHTFGWELSRKENGDCVFIEDIRGGNRCSIYEARPMLCSTYPFYMEKGELRVSECEGLGRETGYEESLGLARKIIDRYIEEIRETILLYENYERFHKGPENINKAMENIREGIINYIVHDSTGSHRTTRRIELTDHSIKDKITD